MSAIEMPRVEDGVLAALERVASAPSAAGQVERSSALDPRKYHRLSDAVKQDPAMAALLGPIGESFGIVVPAADDRGNSMVLDANRPQVVRVNPGEPTEVSVDMGKVTPAAGAEAYRLAQARFPGDASRAASAYYAILAERQKAGLLAGRESVAPARKAAAAAPARTGPATILAAVDSVLRRDENHVAQPGPVKRARRVDFEFPEPVGRMRFAYRDVVRTPDLLILVHDLSLGPVPFFPQAPQDPGIEPARIGVLVYDEDEQPDSMFAVLPTRGQFAYAGVEFCLLAIDREASYHDAEATV